MKTALCLTLTLFTFLALSVAPNIFAQDASPKYVVRTIYIVPNDREPDPDMDAKLNTLMKETQQFYADLMEFHGFGRKTFRLETDATGVVIVHHVNGKHSDAHYQNDSEGSMIVWDEIKEQFDTSKNIHVLALDISDAIIAYGGGEIAGLAEMHSHYGMALVPASDPGVALWHELGHTFGLTHDSRVDANRWINPGTVDPMITSFCAAEWMDVNRYFNPVQEAVVLDDKEAKVEMLKPRSAASPYAIRLQFKVADPDGLHHAQLSRGSFYDSGVIACKKLNGKETTVEFVTSHLIGDGMSEGVTLRLMDKHGNFTSYDFPIDITDLLPKAEIISIPDPKLASAVRETLELAPGDAITQLVMRRLINFSATDRQIADLTGLQHAVNMQDLFLNNNQIRDLAPLEGAKGLTSLDVSDNPISDITPLAKLKHLNRLSCRNAEISDIAPLARLTTLSVLSLVGNPISDITPLAGLTNLFELELGSSQQPINDIAPLAGLVNLRGLTLLYASIKDTDLISSFTELTHLTFIEVPIDDLSFLTGLSKLRSLHLTSCKIDNARPFAGLKNLDVLSLQDNQISDVSPLAELANLEELSLEGNPIEDTKPLRALLRKNPDVKIYLEYGGDPFLFVELSHFSAQRTDAGVVLKWTTESELDNAGFNILRSETKNGTFKVLNPELIKGAGTTDEQNEYTWTDSTAKPNTVYYYQLEDVSQAGVRKQLATVTYSSGVSSVEPLVSNLTTLGNIKRTALLQNYPNPFNPETWVPYQLAEDAMVTLAIYNSSGLVVRTLELGHQSSGSYESRDKAAYWNGRNEDGELVASGVYFYRLSADDYSATRRMLILK